MIKYIMLAITKLPLIPILIVGIIALVYGDYLGKVYAENQNNLVFGGMVLGYIICGIFFTASLFKTELIIATIILEAGYLIGMLLIGFFVFGERFSILQYSGIIISVIGVSILLLSE